LGLVSLLALLGTGSYYLGRSHDNNLLNLLPFLTLTLATALASGLSGFPSGFAKVVLAGLLAWSATFGLQSWAMAWRQGDGTVIGPAKFVRNIRLLGPDAVSLLDTLLDQRAVPHAPFADAAAALNWLHANDAGSSPVWISPAMLLPYGRPDAAWTGMNDLGSYGLLPTDVVEDFIRKGEERLRRQGWLLVDREQQSPWLDIFRAVYQVTEQREFGGYTLYRLAPR
jgi:hypothetical protein